LSAGFVGHFKYTNDYCLTSDKEIMKIATMSLFGKHHNSKSTSKTPWPEGAIPYDNPVSSGYNGLKHTIPSTPYEDTPSGQTGGMTIDGKVYYSKHHKRAKSKRLCKTDFKEEYKGELGVYPKGYPEMPHMAKSMVTHPSMPNPADCTCGRQHAKGATHHAKDAAHHKGSAPKQHSDQMQMAPPSQAQPSPKPSFELKGVQALSYR
jgi:hypothetical protein